MTRARAIIFDFDGVLADTEDLHCAAYQAVATTVGVGLTLEDYHRHYLGLPDRECLAALCQRHGVPLDRISLDRLVAQKREQFARLADRASLYPGVTPVLRQLHARYTLAIASGAFRDEIEPILARSGVRELFAAVVGAEDVRAGKPAPDPFLQALREINRRLPSPLAPFECVVIEDSLHGITAARAAGMRCVAVTTHHPIDVLTEADAVIDHVSRLRVEDL